MKAFSSNAPPAQSEPDLSLSSHSLTENWAQVMKAGSCSLRWYRLIGFLQKTVQSNHLLVFLSSASFPLNVWLIRQYSSTLYTRLCSLCVTVRQCVSVYGDAWEGLEAVCFNSFLQQCQKRLCLSLSVSIWNPLTCSGICKWQKVLPSTNLIWGFQLC